MKKTKIICTIGPSSENPDMIEKLAKAGMNIARLNFSHGDHEEHLRRIKAIQKINPTLETPIAIMQDTQGPEIRLGTFKEKTNLITGETVTLTTKEVLCDNKLISVSYKKLPKTVKKGDLVYIADGTIELIVKQVSGDEVICDISIGGEVNSRKNVNLPGKQIELPAISENDREDIKFGSKNNVDLIAQSFVRTEQDVIDMKKLLKENNSDALVIAKIESMESVYNIDNIIEVSDGIMIARGDLGCQVPIEQVANIQKEIIKKCNEKGKPVIVATQMLESMTKNPKPTRAEVTDVANAIIDGTDAIMLSGETASGNYPLRALDMMVRITNETEKEIDYHKLNRCCYDNDIPHVVGKAVCDVSNELNASVILISTLSGHTAKEISRHKPTVPIIALTPDYRVVNKLNLWWNVHPFLTDMLKNTDDLIGYSVSFAKSKKIIKKGDTIVLAAGIPFKKPHNMNMIKVHVVE